MITIKHLQRSENLKGLKNIATSSFGFQGVRTRTTTERKLTRTFPKILENYCYKTSVTYRHRSFSANCSPHVHLSFRPQFAFTISIICDSGHVIFSGGSNSQMAFFINSATISKYTINSFHRLVFLRLPCDGHRIARENLVSQKPPVAPSFQCRAQ